MSSDPLDVLLAKLRSGDLDAARYICSTFEPYLRLVVRRSLPRALRTKFEAKLQEAQREVKAGPAQYPLMHGYEGVWKGLGRDYTHSAVATGVDEAACGVWLPVGRCVRPGVVPSCVFFSSATR